MPHAARQRSGRSTSPVSLPATWSLPVDYAAILRLADAEADVIVWDGGNNDFPFLRPDLHIALGDALRPRQVATHHPGEAVARMADVLVVAIFMAFIGFNGIIDSQLGDLEDFVDGVHILTTNNSSLEVGFYLFTSYCLLGLGSAVLVQRAMSPKS